MSYATTAAAMASALESATGWRVYESPVLAPQPPCHMLSPQSSAYDRTARDGAHPPIWTVRTLVGAADDVTGTGVNLYGAMDTSGTTSVKAALETDKTLGGVVDSLRVVRHSEPGWYTYGSGTLLGVEFTVEIIA